jgi:hypothetical protein
MGAWFLVRDVGTLTPAELLSFLFAFVSLGSSVLHAHTIPSQPTGNMGMNDAEGTQ